MFAQGARSRVAAPEPVPRTGGTIPTDPSLIRPTPPTILARRFASAGGPTPSWRVMVPATPRVLAEVYRTAARLAALFLGAACVASAPAQTPGGGAAVESRLAQWSLLLDLVTAELDKPRIDRSVVEALRPQVEGLQRDAAEVTAAAGADAEAVQPLLDALGPPPAGGEPAESATVAAERATLEARRTERDGHRKQAELISVRARQVLARIAETRREDSARRLLERGPSPLSWTVLGSVGPHAIGIVRRLAETPFDLWPHDPGVSPWADQRMWFLPALALALGFVLPARRRMLRRYVRDREVEIPSFPHRLRAAILIGVARGVLPALIGVVPLAFLLAVPSERGIAGDLLVAALGALAGAVLTGGLARAALAPYSPEGWRLAPLTGESARPLYRRILALAWLVAGLLLIEYPAARHLPAPPELVAFYGLLANGAVAAFILLLLPRHLWRRRDTGPEESPARDSRRFGEALRVVAAAAAISVPLLALAGFEALASYLAANLVKTAAVLGLVVIAHGVARDSIILALARREPTAETGGLRTHGDDAGTDASDHRAGADDAMLRFWYVVAADVMLAIVAAVVLLRSWGLAWDDIGGWLVAASDGLPVGSFRLSITALLLALVVFVALLAASRWLQRLLETRVFPQTRLDPGVRNSLKTTIGYVGLFIAVTAAISTAGVDLANIAIIAGALSIGIGFGLQNIVNNFVSGLILLVERPIKVGDWIVVGGRQGYVERIKVRATEIQTFERSSVIIPNSELLSSALVNWTHRDAIGRIEVAVGVSYGSDVELVRDTLLEVAAAHPDVMREPAPVVFFIAFGDSSLDFELRCFVPQAIWKLRVGTDMRFEILRLFRARGVEIPFPQRDLHVRGLAALPPAGPER